MRENLYYLMTRLPPIDKNKPLPITPAEALRLIEPESPAREIALAVFGCLTIFNALMIRRGIEPLLLDIYSKEEIVGHNLPQWLQVILQQESPLLVWQAYYQYLGQYSALRFWGLLDLKARNLIAATHQGEAVALPPAIEKTAELDLAQLTRQLKTMDNPEKKDQLVFHWQLSLMKEYLNAQPFSEKELLLYLITLTAMVRCGQRKE